jgi:enolase
MKELLEQYKQAKEVADGLASQLYAAFMSTTTVEEKFKLVLEYGDEFLREEGYYCPHVRTSEGEVSMYDDLWVEQLMEGIYDDCEEIDWDSEDHLSQQLATAAAVINQDTAVAVVLRDMLNKGIRAGTFDW